MADTKHILGLDLGANSIGWSVIEARDGDNGNFLYGDAKLVDCGSRIIPMDAQMMGKYDQGKSIESPASLRTKFRAMRRLKQRSVLRRDRINRVLSVLGLLPQHYACRLDRYGHFPEDDIPRLAWGKDLTGQWMFLFRADFDSMVAEFRQRHPDLKSIPYDWTLYYLRKKALEEPLDPMALAWVIHSFNRKRGCSLMREEMVGFGDDKREEYKKLRVENVVETGKRKGNSVGYEVHLEGGYVYSLEARTKPDWVGEVMEVVIETFVDKEGIPKLDKAGCEKYKIRMPKEDDWALVKARTDALVRQSGGTVGSYIYDALLENPTQKIIGGFVQTVDRSLYREELLRILRKQQEFLPVLRSRELYEDCLMALYPHNEGHRRNLAKRDVCYLLVDDVVFYQRTLKSKKSLIADCPYEGHIYYDRTTGEEKRMANKCIARSHPWFQEFRLRQFISNLRIFRRRFEENGRVSFDTDVTLEFLKDDRAVASLYEHFSWRESVTQKQLLLYFRLSESDYRWNYVEDKQYPGGETRALLLRYLKKAGLKPSVLTSEVELALWHLLYSVREIEELRKGLCKMANSQGWPEAFVEAFIKCPPFPEGYGAYSAKAIRRLLPLMRTGTDWNASAIDSETVCRIEEILRGEFDSGIPQRVRERLVNFSSVNDFRGLPVWLACYVVYGRHSEGMDVCKWTSPNDIDKFLRCFRLHSMRNPIVEQVVMETMRVVRDVWMMVGHIDEIHVELGREMKKNAKERAGCSKRNAENEETNLRIKALLTEFFQSDDPEVRIEGVRPYSHSQQEMLRLYESVMLENAGEELREEIGQIHKKFKSKDEKDRPTASDIRRYKLWLDQSYLSPYTGQPIPLARLFSRDYEIEHIIPRKRYYDDSQSNKVICEAEVNRLKGAQLGLEFIRNCGGALVKCAGGRVVRVLSESEYMTHVQTYFGKNRARMRRLLAEDVPENFTASQLNDSRYISRTVLGLLSNIVRVQDENGEYERELVSRSVVACTGMVTDTLKRDWGLSDVWHALLAPRFKRLNRLEGGQVFGHEDCVNGKKFFRITMPLSLQAGFNLKRIDHRHHAMDAIVISCVKRGVVNYLNNVSASENGYGSRQDFRAAVCRKYRMDAGGNYQWCVRKPWCTFTEDVREALERTVVSFKQNVRTITPTTNYYRCFDEESQRMVYRRQEKGQQWSIRKSLHKDSVYGLINIRTVKEVSLKKALLNINRIVECKLRHRIKALRDMKYEDDAILRYFKKNHDTLWPKLDLKRVKVYVYTSDSEETRMVSKRERLSVEFTMKKIEKVADTSVRRILIAHLRQSGDDAQTAFSPEGIRKMNANLCELNGGHPHLPIYSVSVAEPLGEKFALGFRGNRGSKYVETDKGCNLFFAVYGRNEGGRFYQTLRLNDVIERQKQGLPVAAEVDEMGNKLLFVLSPNDLVYVPTAEECLRPLSLEDVKAERIYRMVSASKKRCFFIPHRVARVIVDGGEFNKMNKIEKTDDGEKIIDICVPLDVDRIGRVSLR